MEHGKKTMQPEGITAEATPGEGAPISPQTVGSGPSSPDAKLSGFAAKHAAFLNFQRENPDYDHLAEEERRAEAYRAAKAEERENKQTFFFYGTLMDPSIAQEVLGLPEPPVLKPAVLRNRGRMRMWGPYPAFQANEEPRADVKGMACEIEGTEKKDRLAAYEGDNYREIPCLINIITEDGEADEILARVFTWNGDEDELSNGLFNLETYKITRAELLKG